MAIVNKRFSKSNRYNVIHFHCSHKMNSLKIYLFDVLQILHAKIRRLEHLIHLKDVRIEDLHGTLQQSVGLGYSVRRR